MGRLRIAFPYLLFAAMALGIVWSNTRAPGAGKPRPMDPNACPPCGMPVAADRAITAEIDGQQQRFCGESCRVYWVASREAAGSGNRAYDPVCRMEVNPAWGFVHGFEGDSYFFCTKQCRALFAEDPETYSGERCLVCSESVDAMTGVPATYLDRTYLLCSDEHWRDFKADPASYFMHKMWGIPDWLYFTSIAIVLLVSFLMFEGVSAVRRLGLGRQRRLSPSAGAAAALPVPAEDRFDLLQLPLVGTLLRSRRFRFAVQAIMVGFFLLIIAAGLFGNPNPGLNIAPILTWTVWWGGLVVLIMFAGKAWCYACPWDAIAGWMERLSFWRKKVEGAGLGLRWPRVVRNISIATILFVGLTWIEIGFGVTMSPVITAYLALAMLVMAVVSAFLFDRKSFCRYGCLVGRVSGLYAMFSGVEIRTRNRKVCDSCGTKECLRGSATAYGCPTFEYPAYLQSNTYCIQCTECLQSCPSDNFAVNLRPWGEDLKAESRPRRDEAYLALLMLSLTSFHGLTMTPIWPRITDALEGTLAVGRILSFSLGMAAAMALPVAIYTLLVWISYRVTTTTVQRSVAPTERTHPGYFDYFVRYAYCVLPIALFYHLAHNLEHLMMEGQKVIAMMSDPFGWGWNLLGTGGWTIPPLVSLDVLWILQVVLVAVGHVYSLWAANKISRRLFTDPVAASRGQWPMLIGMIAFSILSLWLLKQPMEMRTSAM